MSNDSAACRECGAEIEKDGDEWFHARIDDLSHDAAPNS